MESVAGGRVRKLSLLDDPQLAPARLREHSRIGVVSEWVTRCRCESPRGSVPIPGVAYSPKAFLHQRPWHGLGPEGGGGG
jgi:hypothetical protein